MTDRKTEVLAFLQNQWFKNPESARRIYERHAGDRIRCSKFRAAALFMGCLTGRRIRDAFGEDMRHVIVYEEASPEIGGHSASAFAADPEHIRQAIRFWNPKIVIAFGGIAGGGVLKAMGLFEGGREFYFVTAPHPAARHAAVPEELRAVANDVRSRIGMPPRLRRK